MRYSEPGENEETPREQLQTAQALDEDTGLKVARHKPGDVIIPVKTHRMLRLKFTLYGAGISSLVGCIVSLFAPDLLGNRWLIGFFSFGALIGYGVGYFRALAIEFKEGLKESA
jgi:hypothetical protein